MLTMPSQTTMRSISEVLRSAREAAGVRQEDLADAIGTTQTTYSRWEDDTAALNNWLEKIARFEDALDLPRGWVLVEAGYVDVAPADTEAAIKSDRSLSRSWRDKLVAIYRAAAADS